MPSKRTGSSSMSDRCQICGDHRPRSMEDHHLVPRRFGGDDADANMVRLCASCHRAIESIYDDEFWASVGVRPATGDDTVAEYIDRVLAVDESHDPVPKKRLYSHYKTWCERGEMDPATQQRFTKQLTQLTGVGAKKVYVDGEQQRCYTGVRRSMRGVTSR